ncbi:MAG: hypothetical protein GY694_05965 [Gammaproteobacteria bacterium]|nr:hypothetical protein [Gammaproteobacteria bacterium]
MAVVNFVVPAVVMYFTIPDENPVVSDEVVPMKRGAKRIIALFNDDYDSGKFPGPPAVLGILTGLSYLQFLHLLNHIFKRF